MIKIKSTELPDKLIFDFIKDNLLKYTIQFFHKTSDGLRPYGSGVLALIHNNHFILTCSHVAEYSEDLFVRVGKTRYIKVIGEIKYSAIDESEGIDLAYIKIDNEMLLDLSRPYKYITIDKISKHNQKLNAMNYCVIGYPEKNIRFENKQMETGASFYLTAASNEKPYEFYNLDKEDFFLVQMQGKATDMNNGKPTKADSDFYGISGGGLWFLTYNFDPNIGVYSIDYKLIGIMTEFKKGRYFCLIANKIHILIDAFRINEGYEFRHKTK